MNRHTDRLTAEIDLAAEQASGQEGSHQFKKSLPKGACLANMSRAGIPQRTTIHEISGRCNLGQQQEYLGHRSGGLTEGYNEFESLA